MDRQQGWARAEGCTLLLKIANEARQMEDQGSQGLQGLLAASRGWDPESSQALGLLLLRGGKS